MQVCPRNRRRERSRLAVGTARRRRPLRCGWCGTLRAELGTDQGAVSRVARQLGYGVESVRSWVRQADIDDGYAPGVSTAESQRIKDLEQENRELKRANVI
jgi:transposase